MSYEISLNGELENIEIISQDGNSVEIAVADRKYFIDIAEVENEVYSIIADGTSFNVELISEKNKKYIGWWIRASPTHSIKEFQ